MLSDKRNIRKMILNQRNLMQSELIEEKSQKIFDNLFTYLMKDEGFSLRGKNVMIFLSFGSEVNTDIIIEKLWKEGANVFVPIVNLLKPRTLDIVRYEEGMKLSTDNKYGIRELTEKKEVIEAQFLDINLVPGVAFTLEGQRLGYGGGYYDLVLNKMNKSAFKIALCFQSQLMKELPIEEHDELVDIIITESNSYLSFV